MRRRAIPLAALAVENLTVGRMEPVRFIEEAAAAGFGAVGLPLATATAVPLQHEIVGQPSRLAAIRNALRQTGIAVYDVEAFVLEPGRTLADYLPVLEAGAELGARCISVIGGPVQQPGLSPRARTELFAALCEAANGHGLRVGVECMLYRDIRTIAEATALIGAAGASRAGIILDVLHLHRAGTAAAEIAALSPGQVAYAQLCDVASGPAPALDVLPTEARSGRLQPGHGIADLPGFLAALPEGVALAVETPVAAEAGLPTGERLQRTADHARRFLAGWAAGQG